ncbi:FtsX-like permease family protein [Flavobacteriaceae bacterium F89]|uniref:FtsX-like permease family protein n=1 Tax=Cerina litoralis TaxID=2874477 RepID=A0AAE3JN44_9FLAO|nr:FtsX-like permease family protein [Cerina litoralis]MCG2459496.1 FtsX-like permease family protein [Cerina litoralis]
MKLAFQLAYKNLMGAGLRTWLNVGILSFAFVIIIFYNGMIDGWNEQSKRDSIAWEYGYGELRNDKYNPLDPFTIQDAHGVLPKEKSKDLTPILIRQATIYPHGRMMPITIKGIDTGQKTLQLPTQKLELSNAEIPVLIGTRMAASANLKEGDKVLLRWRDKNGTFDATNITVAGIFDTNVPTVDNGQFWISIDKLWEMTELTGNATLFIANQNFTPLKLNGWNFKTQMNLLKDLNDIIAMKKISGSIMYLLLLSIALLAIFDTQVLSVFRRQREIGTYIALGMTRRQVVGLFTVEGSMYSILATIVGCIYGIPIFVFMTKTGIGMPSASQEMGIAVAERIFPVYGAGLIFGTMVLVVASATLVSFLPARKIAKMNPVDALKGKLQ